MKKFKWMIALIVVLLLTAMFSMTAFATNTGNVGCKGSGRHLESGLVPDQDGG